MPQAQASQGFKCADFLWLAFLLFHSYPRHRLAQAVFEDVVMRVYLTWPLNPPTPDPFSASLCVTWLTATLSIPWSPAAGLPPALANGSHQRRLEGGGGRGQGVFLAWPSLICSLDSGSICFPG